ncbi:MAG: bifunctional oligoribonuclease/PAP phosphatase NrnA [Desulfotalea sp.]
MIPKTILNKIAGEKKCLLFCHTRPDGDAIGSLFGLAHMLENNGYETHCFLDEDVPSTFLFLDQPSNLYIGEKSLCDFLHTNGTNFLGIALDCGDIGRLGVFGPDFVEIARTIVIDHHKSHTNFGDFDWVKVDASSTGEMVYEVCEELGWELILPAANPLYVALVSDTGSFNYSCTGKRTHQISGELLGAGVKPEKIAAKLYDNWTLSRLELMKDVLSTLHVCHGGKIASVYVSQAMLLKHGASMEDTESFLDYPRSLSEVEVAIFAKESKAGGFSVSFRAKGGLDVSIIAEQFSGGGHANAAGCRMQCDSVTEAISIAEDAVKSKF